MIDAFYSDPHFGHKKICDYTGRPFNSPEDMRDAFIINYNNVVRPWEICLWLGDAFLCPLKEAQTILGHMNGKKIILCGNHDRSAVWLAKVGFDIVIKDYLNLRIADTPVRACHYPYKYKNDEHDYKTKKLYPIKHKGEVLLHGHTHTKDRLHGNQIHVGLDAWYYGPVTMYQVFSLIRMWKNR